jgi:hypothetical protein
MLLLGVACIPLLDLAIVPIRWMMAQELINSYVRTLSMCETFSESQRAIETDPSLKTRLQRLGGTNVNQIDLRINITRVSHRPGEASSLDVTQPGRIPAAWLPDGSFAPCMYLLKLDVKASIDPAILFRWSGMRVPGLTESIPVLLTASHEWPNLGQDPATEKFFINE